MKKNSGITLISLVEIIVLLILISSVSISVSIGSYDVIKIENFVTRMKMIQSKVDNIAEEGSFENLGLVKLVDLNDSVEDKEFFEEVIHNPLDYNINTETAWFEVSDTNPENYYYFTGKDLEKIGLRNEKMTVIINFQTRNVISKQGIKKDGEKYYRQYDLANGDENITSPNIVSIPAGLEVGTTVSYTPSGTYTEWTTAHSGYETSYILATGSAYTDSSVQTDMTISNWRVFKINETTGEIQLVPSAPTTATVGLKGADGYNNAVKLLNDACSSLYGKEGVTARSINIDDIEDKEVLDYDKSTYVNTSDSSESVKYNEQKTNAYEINKTYPAIYEEELDSVINSEVKGKSLGLSDAASDWITGSVTNAISIRPKQTYYSLSNREFFKGNYANLLLFTESSAQYWVASRSVFLDASDCRFGVRHVNSGGLGAYTVFISNGETGNGTRPLFPILSLNVNKIVGDKTSGFSVE